MKGIYEGKQERLAGSDTDYQYVSRAVSKVPGSLALPMSKSGVMKKDCPVCRVEGGNPECFYCRSK